MNVAVPRMFFFFFFVSAYTRPYKIDNACPRLEIITPKCQHSHMVSLARPRCYRINRQNMDSLECVTSAFLMLCMCVSGQYLRMVLNHRLCMRRGLLWWRIKYIRSHGHFCSLYCPYMFLVYSLDGCVRRLARTNQVASVD